MSPLPPALHPVGQRLARIGLWLQLAPLVDLVPMVTRLWAVLREVQAQVLETGLMPDPVRLSQQVAAAMAGSFIGTGLSLVGAGLILLAYVRYRHRPAWAFWFLAAFAVLGLLSGVLWLL